MTFVSLISLFVYLFGAYAYGAATVLGFREASPVWNRRDASRQPQLDDAPLVLIVISTIWFILHTLIEFRNLTGNTDRGWLDVATFMVFVFPPVIMQTVYREASCEGDAPPPRIYRQLLLGMYVLSPLVGAITIAAIFEVITLPIDIGPLVGSSIGSLFILASIYSTAIMLRRKERVSSPDRRQLRTVMN